MAGPKVVVGTGVGLMLLSPACILMWTYSVPGIDYSGDVASWVEWLLPLGLLAGALGLAAFGIGILLDLPNPKVLGASGAGAFLLGLVFHIVFRMDIGFVAEGLDLVGLIAMIAGVWAGILAGAVTLHNRQVEEETSPVNVS